MPTGELVTSDLNRRTGSLRPSAHGLTGKLVTGDLDQRSAAQYPQADEAEGPTNVRGRGPAQRADLAASALGVVAVVPACRAARGYHSSGAAGMLVARWALRRLVSAPQPAVSMADPVEQRMVWVDLEMTGLDIQKDQIIEMACLITDSDLNILAEGPNLIIKQPDELLDSMSNWCKEHHGKSGLTQAVRDSKISLAQAEYEFLSFIRKHTAPGLCPLAGRYYFYHHK
ncbi:hypothetical protein GDO78_011298 [Eleutherodactylus coqui]|uniref:Exonuclease domain-containing protein n=1 Tax=Eleutherodactylus coqui TaxID=57060 RepID=A0A8J6F852_ELECQ|nr:hypothetical protein GDO78_011298 [Eleutherodactylus coqui]